MAHQTLPNTKIKRHGLVKLTPSNRKTNQHFLQFWLIQNFFCGLGSSEYFHSTFCGWLLDLIERTIFYRQSQSSKKIFDPFWLVDILWMLKNAYFLVISLRICKIWKIRSVLRWQFLRSYVVICKRWSHLYELLSFMDEKNR